MGLFLVKQGGQWLPSKHQVGGSIPSGIATKKLSGINALGSREGVSERRATSTVLCDLRRGNAGRFGENSGSPSGLLRKGPQTVTHSPTARNFRFRKSSAPLGRAFCFCPDCVGQVIGGAA